MDRYKLLAAELYGYSYHNYDGHEGNLRYDTLMPNDAKIMEKAIKQNWSKEKIAKKLEIDIDKVDLYLEKTRNAIQIVDSPTPAESFRRGVRVSIKDALIEGLKTEEDIEKLVVQICYRAADLGYLLDTEYSKLSDYSEELRHEEKKYN